MPYKYEIIANYIKEGISNDVFSPGDKLPSLRVISSRFKYSMSVAIQAYTYLERQRLIISVEKSGYFIAYKKRYSIPQPEKYDLSLKSLETKSNTYLDKIIAISNNKNILPLGATIPDISLLAVNKVVRYITKELKEKPDSLARYTHSLGSILLREELSKYMFNKGVRVKSNEIVITNGCEEALYLAVECSTKEGDTVAIESPVFFGLISILEKLKRKVIEIPTSPERGIDLDILEQNVNKSKIKAVLISSSFQNPLCFSINVNDKKRLYEIASSYNLYIIEDDIYSDCSFNGETNFPVKSLDKDKRVIYCSSFSKTIAPGLRIGWAIPGKIIQKLSLKKSISSLGNSVILQESIAEYLKSGNYNFHLKQFRKKIRIQTYEMRSLVEKYFPDNTKISMPKGGYFLWVELDKKIDSIKIFKEALRHKIGISPGPVFSASNNFKNCIRISCGSPLSTDIKNGIKKLGQIVKKELNY